jgi:hypothetical protein
MALTGSVGRSSWLRKNRGEKISHYFPAKPLPDPKSEHS